MSLTIAYTNIQNKHSSEEKCAFVGKLIIKNKRSSFSSWLKENLEQNIVLGRAQEFP